MIQTRKYCCASAACVFFLAWVAVLTSPRPARAPRLSVPPEAPAILDRIYSFDLDGAVGDAKRMEQERPDHPLGYLLEAEAWWWRIWCLSAEFKYGMTDARRRSKLPIDQHYLELAAKASSLAGERLKEQESAE